MVEFFPATGVYWYPATKHYVLSKSSNPTQLTGNCVDSFFSKDVLKVSNLKGGGMGRYCPLNHRLISAIQCKVILQVLWFRYTVALNCQQSTM